MIAKNTSRIARPRTPMHSGMQFGDDTRQTAYHYNSSFTKIAVVLGILCGLLAIVLLLCAGFAEIPAGFVFAYILAIGVGCYVNIQFMLGMQHIANKCAEQAHSNEKIVELLSYISERTYEIQDNLSQHDK